MERQEGRRLFTWGLTLILCLTLLMPCAALAAEAVPALQEYVVISASAKVYQEPSLASGTEIVATLRRGTTFTGVSMTRPDEPGPARWIQMVNNDDGLGGFVQSEDVALAEGAVASGTKLVVSAQPYLDDVTPGTIEKEQDPLPTVPDNKLYYMVNGEDVNVRSAPSMEGNNKLTQYDTGKLVEVLSIENGWAKIQYGEGVAYIAENLLESFTLPEEVTYTGTDELNVLNSDGDVIGALNANTEVVVTEIDENGMATIQYGDDYAYVSWNALWGLA